MKHYVKVSAGRVIGMPKVLSSSETESPNSNWGPEQMKLNGYVIVDVSHDILKEDIDYANPIVNGDLVTYNRIPLSSTEIKLRLNAEADFKRMNEYPTIHEMVVALWEMVVENDMKSVNDLQTLRESIKAKYPKESL